MPTYLGQLVDEVSFAAGATGKQVLGGAVQAILKEVFDSYTALYVFDELYVPNYEIPLVGPSGGTAGLPADFQRMDLKRVRYQIGADPEHETFLSYGPSGTLNEGPTNKFSFIGYFPPATNQFIQFYPYNEVVTGDVILIDYWKSATVWPEQLVSQVYPEMLLPVVKQEAIAKLALALGNKEIAMAARQDAIQARNRMHGLKINRDCNGE